MLVLSRRIGQEIVIDGGIRIVVVSVNGRQVQLGIVAPEGVRIDRLEIARLRESGRTNGRFAGEEVQNAS